MPVVKKAEVKKIHFCSKKEGYLFYLSNYIGYMIQIWRLVQYEDAIRAQRICFKDS